MNKCLECKSELFGRVDKKYCSDQCRNAFNNREKRSDNNYIRNVNNALRKNHRILQGLLKEDKTAVKKEKLMTLGFNFNYHTSLYQTKDNRVYFYSYDVGIINTNDDWYTILKKKEW